MRLLTVGVCLAAGVACAAAPRVDQDEVVLKQDAQSRLVTVTYVLRDAPGVVTLDVQTNASGTARGPWVSIGAQNFATAEGALNKVVRELERPQTITWRPYVSWPGGKETNGVRAVVTAWATNAPPDYMVLDLVSADSTRFYATVDALPGGGLSNDVYRTSKLVMRKIPAAYSTFRMGAPWKEIASSTQHYDQERAHLVTLTNDYYLSVYVLTRAQYATFYGGNTPAAGDAQRPLNNINWKGFRGASDWPSAQGRAAGHAVGANSFFAKLRAHAQVDDLDYPTDAQWEFACRAGSGFRFIGGNRFDDLRRVAWYVDTDGTGGSQTTQNPVGKREPNAWGLYDMLGNTWEFCLDWLSAGEDYTDGSPVVEPDGVTADKAQQGQRVVRGGANIATWQSCRCGYRVGAPPSTNNARYSVRVCCPAVVK